MRTLAKFSVAGAALFATMAFDADTESQAGSLQGQTCAGLASGVVISPISSVFFSVSPGDIVTIVADPLGDAPILAVNAQNNAQFLQVNPGDSGSFEVPPGDDIAIQVFVSQTGNNGDGPQIQSAGSVSCSVQQQSTPPPDEVDAAPPESLANQSPDVAAAPSTEDVQEAFSSVGMMNHLDNLYDDIHRNTAGVLNGGGTPIISQNGLFLQSAGKSAMDIPGTEAPFNVFLAAELTNYDGDSFDGLNGALTLGVDYRVSNDIIVGALVSGSRSDFSTLINANVGGLESTGITLGIYGAANVLDGVTIDGLLTWSGLDYDVANGGTTGDFNANRFGISVGVYNQMPFLGATLEPHARIIYGFEDQESYVDSVGRTVGSNTVNAGRIILGPRLIAPTTNGFTPWIRANAVYEFSDSGSLATGAPDFDDVFSAQVGLGFEWDTDLGELGGEINFGGLGSGEYNSVGGTFNYALSF
ncbi:MAG: autotransporter outer membrane beta-barrel domain-containing protein [Pseudomonadota bacterium]